MAKIKWINSIFGLVDSKYCAPSFLDTERWAQEMHKAIQDYEKNKKKLKISGNDAKCYKNRRKVEKMRDLYYHYNMKEKVSSQSALYTSLKVTPPGIICDWILPGGRHA